MRIYLPATAGDLADDAGVTPRWAHTVTGALRREMPDEEDEGLEMTATLAAADDSVRLLAGAVRADTASSLLVPRRVVAAADVPDDAVAPAGADGDRLPTAVRLRETVTWDHVVALLVDEAAAEEDVAAAAAGDEEALERSAERDLLWYDVTERVDLLGELSAGR
ncbi:DUF6912 family protein [Georgenia alba]|uniref:DUF6912 family protein n=1 Tax=Georgenia alba TaxID=2233858 RepID=A0ABW2QA97_9MICO